MRLVWSDSLLITSNWLRLRYRGQKNVTFWSAHKQTCRVDIDGERRGGCINEVVELEEIQQSTRVNNGGGGGGVGGSRRRWSRHWSHDERDGEAGIGVE